MSHGRSHIGALLRSGVTGLALLTAILAGATPAHAELKIPQGRFALGDSVMLGAKDDLKALGFRPVDAVESRQAYAAPAMIHRLGGSIPDTVVIHLGTNGTFPLETCKRIVKEAGPQRRVFLVTVHVHRSWTKPNNTMMRVCAGAFALGQVTVIDWDFVASRRRGWLYADGTHLTPTGAAGYARLLDAATSTSRTRPDRDRGRSNGLGSLA